MPATSPRSASATRTEQIILFRVGGQLFALSSASVQEVRGVDSLAGSSAEISVPGLRKVRHVVQRGDRSLFVVNAAAHFGLPQTPGTLVFVLRRTRTALLVDGIDQMTSMTRLQSLPNAFCHEERSWYRGLTSIDQMVVPVVSPDGFLTPQEIALLDSTVAARQEPVLGGSSGDPASTELPQ
jgi:chemotaxis signal transduction protein